MAGETIFSHSHSHSLSPTFSSSTSTSSFSSLQIRKIIFLPSTSSLPSSSSSLSSPSHSSHSSQSSQSSHSSHPDSNEISSISSKYTKNNSYHLALNTLTPSPSPQNNLQQIQDDPSLQHSDDPEFRAIMAEVYILFYLFIFFWIFLYVIYLNFILITFSFTHFKCIFHLF